MTDYSKSSIYKIACKDPAIEDTYIGSTCNLIKRRNQHKNVCNNSTNKDHNMYVYRFIRNNGGWQNWGLYVIEEFNCNTKMQKSQVERGYIESLKPTLNKRVPANHQTGNIWDQKEYLQAYYEENKEAVTEYKKKWHEQNKDRIVEYNKGYYESHEAERKEYQQKTIHCTHCNHMINLHHKARHNKTKRHISNSSESSLESSSEGEPDTIMFQMNKLHDDNVLKLQEIQNTFDKIDKLIH